MATNPTAYKQALYPPSPWQAEHQSDEDVAYQLDRIAKRSAAARKAHERARQKRAEQQVAQEKAGEQG